MYYIVSSTHHTWESNTRLLWWYILIKVAINPQLLYNHRNSIPYFTRKGNSFIGGGNRSTRKQPPNCRKSPTNFIKRFSRVHLTMSGIQTYLWSFFPVFMVLNKEDNTIILLSQREIILFILVKGNNLILLCMNSFVHSYVYRYVEDYTFKK